MTKIDQGITLRLTTKYRQGKSGGNHEVIGPAETLTRSSPGRNPNHEVAERWRNGSPQTMTDM
jgi:hypothetical protein